MKKKRSIGVIISGVMILALTGCGRNAYELQKQDQNRQLSLNFDNTRLYVVDYDGKLLNEYDLAKVKEQFSEEIPGLRPENYRMAYDGVLYFTDYYTDYKDSSNSYNILYAIDPEKDAYTVVYKNDGGSIYNLDIYDGKLYFESMIPGTSNFEGHCYLLEDGLTYEETASGLEEYYRAMENYSGCSRGNGNTPCCVARTFDEVGFSLARKDNKLFKIEKNGDTSQIYQTDEGNKINVYAFDRKWVMVKLSNSNYEDIGEYILNIDSGEAQQFKEANWKEVICYDDSTCYYSKSEPVNLGIKKNQIYSYNLVDGSTKLLYETETVPGTQEINNLEYSRKIFGKRMFFACFDDGKYIWNMLDPTKSDGPKPLGYVASDFPAYEYGTVEYVTAESDCPDCGKALYKFYGEKFVLDHKYSEYADEINKRIAEFIDNSVIHADEGLMYGDTDCEEHGELEEAYCESENGYITDVNILEDRYLDVLYISCFNFGGAHGEYFREQFFFDLKTGKRLSIEDFYKGTEEEFKDLIARKVVEDYKENRENYFAESDDEAYKQAYDCVKFDDRSEFKEDGIDFVFDEYALGPYASGFIIIHVSYEELLGRSTLSE
ncbi:RsiV family protein [Butyrivibrio sp. MC2021]|uniref:RsiV family protein n=1 Tax=Butyrivibrio sp. MC2021 TaxID=1408306 RepID=UPI00047D9E0A|nr:RsiV family protein [Butyrivibrio sp. MC2021]